MYARQVAGRTLTLGVSGMLWEGNLVMVDEETGSLWSHLLGEAMRGPLQGKVLEQIPSVMTDWGTWRSRHPDSTVVLMRRSTGHYTRDFHMPDSGLVLGLAEGDESRTWSFSDLYYRKPVVNDSFAGRPVLVVFEKDSFTALVYDRTLDGEVLAFTEEDGKLVDRTTRSEWDRLTGEALTGPLQGNRLARLPGVVSDHAVWIVYHPESTLWRPDATGSR